MVKLYFTTKEAEEEKINKLSPARRERVMHFSGKRRKEVLACELLLSAILPEYGYTAEDIFYEESGKPCLPHLFMSLSHSHGGVLLALSNEPVGCDVERIRPAPLRVLKLFSPRERALVTGEERDKAFFRLWTAKESYLKLTGEGVKALSEVEVFEGGILRKGKSEPYLIRAFEEGEYLISVCSCEWECVFQLV